MPQGSATLSALPRPTKRKKRFSAVRIVMIVLVVILVAVALFYALGAWYFSNLIRDGALIPEGPGTPEYDITVEAIGEDTITLVGPTSDDHLAADGVYGIGWPDGYAQTSGLASTEPVGNDRTRVVRTFRPIAGTLTTSDLVDLDGYAYPDDPTAAFGVTYANLTYETDLGIADTWYLPGSQPVWMIFVHGKDAPKREALRLLPVAIDRGYHALVINYRNDPGAPRDPSGYHQYGVTEWADVAAAARFARSNGAEKTVFVGYSMGGGIVASFLTQSPLQDHAAAVILDAPNLDFESTIDFRGANRELPLVGIGVPESLISTTKWTSAWRFDIDWDDYDWIERSDQMQTPMLVFHGTSDESVPLETSQILEQKRPDLVTLIEVPGAGHVLSWNVDPNAYVEAVTAFLDAHVG
jgi:pimeloyl-ACP methyl ester carboxylesterase